MWQWTRFNLKFDWIDNISDLELLYPGWFNLTAFKQLRTRQLNTEYGDILFVFRSKVLYHAYQTIHMWDRGYSLLFILNSDASVWNRIETSNKTKECLFPFCFKLHLNKSIKFNCSKMVINNNFKVVYIGYLYIFRIMFTKFSFRLILCTLFHHRYMLGFKHKINANV